MQHLHPSTRALHNVLSVQTQHQMSVFIFYQTLITRTPFSTLHNYDR